MEEYNVRPNVLKIDCEGCEYDIILRNYDTLSLFEQVIFEYHADKVGIPRSRLPEALSWHFFCEPINEQIYKDKELGGAYYCVKKK